MGTPIERMRALVARYGLSYYFNPGGVEFFSCGHPAVPHCQTGEYEEEDDATKLAAWCVQHDSALTGPKEPIYWHESEGEMPGWRHA